MKPITAIIVFFSLMFPALFLGYNNYAEAKENIIKDVNQALAKTVIYKMPTKITADTLQVFKSNLQINQLKETSYPPAEIWKYTTTTVSVLAVKGFLYRMALSAI